MNRKEFNQLNQLKIGGKIAKVTPIKYEKQLPIGFKKPEEPNNIILSYNDGKCKLTVSKMINHLYNEYKVVATVHELEELNETYFDINEAIEQFDSLRNMYIIFNIDNELEL